MITVRKTPQNRKYITSFLVKCTDTLQLTRFTNEVNIACWEENGNFVNASDTTELNGAFFRTLTFNENVRPLDAKFIVERISKQIEYETASRVNIEIVDSEVTPSIAETIVRLYQPEFETEENHNG